MIEIKTIRMEGHFMGDVEQYRPEEEKSSLPENDPIPKFRARILTEGIISEDQLTHLETEARAEVEGWIDFARDSEYPAPEAALITDFTALQNRYSERK
jgi:pyruvate dehydrogenase E1 component alpha subunit